MLQLQEWALLPTLVTGFGSAVLYVIMLGLTFTFLMTYIKRMINIAFLIMISPLITVTYAIDKMADGKSQALNTWLKEFVYSILIQPFHCILFLIFVSTSYGLITGGDAFGNFGALVFSIMCITFMTKAEGILRKIFAFDAKAGTTMSNIASAALIGAGVGQVTNMLKGQGNNKGSLKGKDLKGLMPDAPTTAPSATPGPAQAGNSQQSGGTQQGGNSGGGAGGNAGGNTPQSVQLPRPESATDKAKRYGKKYMDVSLKGAGAVFATALGASNGTSLREALTFGVGGYAATGAAKSKIGNISRNKAIRDNEKVFEKAYQIYQNDLLKEFGSQEGILEASKKLLKQANLGEIRNPAVREYAKYLQGLNNTYAYTGDSKSAKSTLDQLKYTQGISNGGYVSSGKSEDKVIINGETYALTNGNKAVENAIKDIKGVKTIKGKKPTKGTTSSGGDVTDIDKIVDDIKNT